MEKEWSLQTRITQEEIFELRSSSEILCQTFQKESDGPNGGNYLITLTTIETESNLDL